LERPLLSSRSNLPSSDENGEQPTQEQETAEGTLAGEEETATISSFEVPSVLESELIERRSPILYLLSILLLIIIFMVAIIIFEFPSPTSVALFPTPTTIPPTLTQTPTRMPEPSETGPPTKALTETPLPLPTETSRPPQIHNVAAGESLFGLSLRFGVSIDSIIEASGLSPNSGIQVNQQLSIPWPTSTPPLEPILLEIGGETVLADPTNCQLYEILGGDTFFGIAARMKVDLRALTEVNRLTEQSILQPGDRICIPKIIRGAVLPPTPGPSPTPSATPPAPGPELLYPISDAVVDPPEGPLVLQWVAVKDLGQDESYMVEMTDLTAVDSHAWRGFTRQTSFRVPNSWRPLFDEVHTFRWRVNIVRITGQREDGSLTYTFGGNSSDEDRFTWLGAIPTVTPTQRPTIEAES
jgi:LysM repeat protein